MRFLLFIIVFTLLSCTNKAKNQEQSVPSKKFEMYEMSEMALLMEQMYVDTEILKQKIVKGENIGKFPSHFLKIHNAVMTDEQENDIFFKTKASEFIKTYTMIYEDTLNAQKHFKNTIDACITCHEVKCGGPIQRIKKLYIK